MQLATATSAAGSTALTQRLSFPARDGEPIAGFLHWFNSVAPTSTPSS